MEVSPRLWLDPEELETVTERLEAERRAARALDERILAEWESEEALASPLERRAA